MFQYDSIPVTTYTKLRVPQGWHWTYNVCYRENAKSYKIDQVSHNQFHRTSSKIVARIHRIRNESKIEDVFGEYQLGCRRGKRNRDAIGMLRIMSETNLYIDEELYAWFKDWQKAFDRVNRKTWMQILKGNSIDWRERRLLRKLAWINVTTGPKEDKKCGDFKRRCTNMIYFIDFFQMVLRIP